ncbi:MAG TPA: hypothetical protein VMG12_33485 [Polyangiaceae bacterium]|nr:hypothetical protein [Polyangiaceae bacterium]
MRARVGSGIGDNPRPSAATGFRWLVFVASVLAAGFGLLVVPHAARAQSTTSTTSSLTPLRSPKGQITLIPNAQGVERDQDYYTPTRPWWINYNDCVAADEFTFTLTSTVTGNTLEIWAGSENCATNRSRTDRGQCWILAAEPLQADTIEVKVPVRNIIARILNTTLPPTNVGRDVCDQSDDPTGEALTLYFMVVDSGQGSEYFAWDGGNGGIGFDTVGPSPPGSISVGIGESQLAIDLDDVPTDPERQRYEAFCVPRGTTWQSLGIGPDAGAGTGTTGGTSTATDADAGDGGIDAGSSGSGSSIDAGTGSDPDGAPAACFTEVLRKGERPPPEFSCGEANAVSRKLRTSRLVNNTDYAVAVAGQDSLGNAGVASTIQCGTPILLRDFYEKYNQAGGPGGGGFCSLRPGQQRNAGALGAVTLALALVGLAARRKKGRA